MRTSRSPRSPRRFLSQRVLALAAVAVLGFSAAQEQGGQRQCRAYPLVQGVSLRDGKSSTAGSKNTTKLVHFVRHAQGLHNVAAHKFERGSPEYLDALSDSRWADAVLSDLGQSQCEALREKTRGMEFDLLMVSPLTRTLQTAFLSFEGLEKVKVLAVEEIRERYGQHPCDTRRPSEEVSLEYPLVDFSLIPSGPDPQTCAGAGECGERESFESMDARIQAFLSLLKGRDEEAIVVVGHSALFARMFEAHLGWSEEQGPFRFLNAEMRSVSLVFN